MIFFKNIIFTLCFSCLFFFAKGQQTALSFAQTINPQDLKRHLSVLASDSLEGRETGTEGNFKAARYIAKHFRGLGLPPLVKNTFFQPVAFTAETWIQSSLSVNGKEYSPNWDFYTLPAYNSNLDISANQVLFAGYGIEDEKYSDYKKLKRKAKGKILLIYNGEPTNSDGVSLLTSTTTPSDWTTNMQKKLEVARRYGAKMLLIIDGNFLKNLDKNRLQIIDGSLKMGEGLKAETRFCNSIFITTQIAKDILGDKFKAVVAAREQIEANGVSKSVKIPCKVKILQEKNIKQLKGNNVLGYIEGTDEKLKEELVIITAHYDHLGKRGEEIFHGADDDGSGTSAVLEIAEAFAAAQRMGIGPRRSVLCMLVTGEEKGLLGSEYYANFPIFPLSKTVANVNIDMVGRTDEKHASKKDYIYVIGSDKLSNDLHLINEQMNATYLNMELDYTYNSESDPNRYYYRSDHYNFAKRGIPVVFYFNGTHEDYHRTTDTVDKINFEMLARRAQLAFFTAWELANRNERIKLK
jgi:hypothetical protein